MRLRWKTPRRVAGSAVGPPLPAVLVFSQMAISMVYVLLLQLVFISSLV